MKLVEVRWVDSVALNHGWNTPRHYSDRAKGAARSVRTAGYLVRKTRRHVDIAHSTMDTNQNIDHVMSIPRGQIVSVRRLR